MRVAVHQDDGTVFAYKLGRIVDGQHNHNLVTGEITPIQNIIDGLVEQAKKEFPDSEVVVERLHDNGDETSEWRSVDETVTPVENNEVLDHELVATQDSNPEQENN